MADEPLGSSARWLTIAPKGQRELQIALLKPDPSVQGKKMAQDLMNRIGKGTTWVLEVDDCQKTYEELISRGVKFAGPPAQKPYGVEAVFEDLYGNPWVLIQPK